MPPFTEVLHMVTSQAFGRTYIPNIDLAGKTVIVTGANTGLGFECAKHLARLNTSRVILACRNKASGEAARARIMKETGYKNGVDILVWELDLANYDSMIAFGQRVRTELPRLDAFIANAGMEIQEFQVAEDLEKHLTVNVVSTFLSAIVALPKLKETAKEHNVDTNLTFGGSMYHIFGPDAEFDAGLSDDVDMFDILSDPAKTDIVWRYAQSKLMVHLCMRGLVAQLEKSKDEDWSRVVVNIVNPGWCGTDLSRAKHQSIFEKGMFALIGYTAEKGSRTYLHAISAGKQSHGRYLSECQYREHSSFVCSERGKRIQEKMWHDLMRRIRRINIEASGFIC